MVQMLNVRFSMKNDTAEKWKASNPVLLKGEMGLEIDTNKFKFGDGTTAWNDLKYASGTLDPSTQIVEGLKINGVEIEKNEDNSIDLPLATADEYGLVKADGESLTAENGVLSVSKLEATKLYLQEGNELILDGGHS